MNIKILFFILLAYPLCNFAMEAPKTQPTFIRGELKEREDDLSDKDWIEIINDIASKLEDIYLPDIHTQSIAQFKEDMLRNEFSLSNLRKSLQKNFGIGHLGIARTIYDEAFGLPLLRKELDPEKTRLKILAFSSKKGKPSGYLFEPSEVNTEAIYNDINNINNSERITVRLLKSKNGNVPLITVPTFTIKKTTEPITLSNIHLAKIDKNTMLNDMDMMAQKTGKNYDNIILDLRGNGGGNARLTYHFLSLLLGNNDPDIHPVDLVRSGQSFASYHQEAENILNDEEFPSLYKRLMAESLAHSDLIPVQKNIAKSITFKKMIVLVNEETGSGGEIAAAALKNTLGSKVCIVGKPCTGSFEEDDSQGAELPHGFVLSPPSSGRVFYSAKYKKLLTGYRLLPDIRYTDMSTIINKALELIDQSVICPEEPSYERTIQQ